MKKDRRSTMLECWRPPTGAGDPVGFVATTFTFDPSFFEEECLTRFLNIDSHPDQEGLAFLLEREDLLGSVYAGVFIDHRQSGVDHSLRWNVLPVRIPGHYQHAKIAILAWSKHIRILISSANLTVPGYRNNQEVVGLIDLTPESSNHQQLGACSLFINELIEYVPSAGEDDPVLKETRTFIQDIQNQIEKWEPATTRNHLFNASIVFTLPEKHKIADEKLQELNGGSALNGCLDTCIKFGGAPTSVKVVSPFFNQEGQNGKKDEVTAQLCKRMARGSKRKFTFCLPRLNSDEDENPRLAAPSTLYNTAVNLVARLNIESLPLVDQDKHPRPWHAKMLWLENDKYAALMIGSSNFTSPAMGLRKTNNTEANILYITPKKAHAKNIGQLEKCWPETITIKDVNDVEWTGINYPLGEEDIEDYTPLPKGFLTAHFHAGSAPEMRLSFLQEKLPETWDIFGEYKYETKVFDANEFTLQQRPSLIRIPWKGKETPGKLLVQWLDKQAFWVVNVENAHDLPLAPEIELMTAHDLICILSTFDYSMALRAWSRQHEDSWTDEDLDSAIPAELDPLKRFHLKETFLHRIRTRARMLASIRNNLERPAWSEKSLQWRLDGILGIKSLAEKLMTGFESDNHRFIETVLELADFFIMLSEVQYQETVGAIDRKQFYSAYQPFLRSLLEEANTEISGTQNKLPRDVSNFWERTCDQCLR